VVAPFFSAGWFAAPAARNELLVAGRRRIISSGKNNGVLTLNDICTQGVDGGLAGFVVIR